MTDLLVEARDVSRTYRGGREEIVAVAAATCSVRAGDRIALEGRSGSGKSTLLQMLGGIEAPTSGSIRWPALGKREDLRPRHIAFVFQRESLLAPLNVLENVQIALLLQGAAREQTRERAMEALQRFGLDDLAAKLPEELSGGQSQRVSFARAIAMRPQFILADEPTGQLDTATAELLLSEVLGVLDELGSAVVIATHDARVAERMRTRWKIARGRLEVPDESPVA